MFARWSVLFVLSAAIGCATDPASPGEAPADDFESPISPGGKADDANGLEGLVDVRATHCEAWIDKAYVYVGHHSAFGDAFQYTLFLKLDLAKLEEHGGVTGTGFFGRRLVHGDRSGTQSDTDFQTWLLTPYFSEDYYQITFQDLVDEWWENDGYFTYEGSFYVDTEDGTRFWVNAPTDNINFVIDANLLEDTRDIYDQWFGYYGRHGSRPTDVGSLDSTADYFTHYLNPQGCR